MLKAIEIPTAIHILVHYGYDGFLSVIIHVLSLFLPIICAVLSAITTSYRTWVAVQGLSFSTVYRV